MIAIRNLSILLWAILFATLAACGDDDDPQPSGPAGPQTPSDPNVPTAAVGHWTGMYADSGRARIILGADKSFAGVWGCDDASESGFPQTCDFSAWTKGEGGQAPAAVALADLSGSWFGTFDRASFNDEGELQEQPDSGERLQTMQFTITNSTIDGITLNDTDTELSASINNTTEVFNAFRFTVNEIANLNGVLVAIPSSDTHSMLFVYSNGQVGVLQKGASALPEEGYRVDEIQGAWQGITVRTSDDASDDSVQFSPLAQASSSASCTTNLDTDPAATSECDITIDSAQKTASGLTLTAAQLPDADGGNDETADQSGSDDTTEQQ